MTIKKIGAQFLAHIQQKRTTGTYTQYKVYIHKFLGWAGAGHIRRMDKTRINKYQAYLQSLGLAPRTIYSHLVALRRLIHYIHTVHANVARIHKNMLTSKEIMLPRVVTQPRHKLHGAETHALLIALAKANEPNIIKLRNTAMAMLLLYTKLSCAHIARLTRSDLHIARGTLHAPDNRMRMLPKEVLDACTVYLQHRKDNHPPLLLRHDRAGAITKPKPLSPRSMQRIIKKYAIDAGIHNPVTPSSLR